MDDEKKQADAAALRNAPRIKNIGYADCQLKEADGTVFATVRPGEVLVGEQYLPFVGNNMGPLKWLNKPQADDSEIVFITGGK